MNIDGQPPPGERPAELYCRQITWADGEAPNSPGRIGVQYTCDVALFDHWVDELPGHDKSEMIERVELYAAVLDWGHDVAPRMLRLMQRKSR